MAIVGKTTQPSGGEIGKGSVAAWHPWYALLFIAVIMGLIMLLAPYQTFELQPRQFTFDYPWKLPDPSLLSRSVVWTLYGLHQIGIWSLIYKAQHSNLSYVKGLHSVNVQALLLNATFVLIHIAQTKLTYDGLAQDVPEFSALASVALMLFAIIIMENDRRGMFFGKKALVPAGVGAVVRRYHGYYFAWAITYTFWYHPIATTPGHLMGFFYMLMLFVQGSLFMTRAHVNRWWTATLELFVVFHGATVAWFAAHGQGGPNWAQFLFGGLGIFLITQMHGVALKPWHKWLLLTAVVSASAAYYALNTDQVIGLARTMPTRYVFVMVLAGLIWLAMRPFVRGRVASQ
jgi:hypothetical protein